MIKKTQHSAFVVLVVYSIYGLFPMTALAASEESIEYNTEYSKKGATTCIVCHDEDYQPPIYPIFETKHGEINDPRTPMGSLQCESCHGPVGEHKRTPAKGIKRAPIITFGKDSWVPVAKQNGMCMQCHADHRRISWQGSAHQMQDMLCVSCHVLHKRHDPMLDRQEQPKTCLRCHVKERAAFQKTSAHPVRYGQVKCSECHNPHGSFAENSLVQNTKNQTCYNCHAEKRGPFLWSHAPVMEDCTLCHETHGSIHPSLLKKRLPLLCQQCHSVVGHPSVAYDGSGLASGSAPNQFLLGKSCLNCHSQIHGSNHPSGVKLMR